VVLAAGAELVGPKHDRKNGPVRMTPEAVAIVVNLVDLETPGPATLVAGAHLDLGPPRQRQSIVAYASSCHPTSPNRHFADTLRR
jgi:hypothetical protein